MWRIKNTERNTQHAFVKKSNKTSLDEEFRRRVELSWILNRHNKKIGERAKNDEEDREFDIKAVIISECFRTQAYVNHN